MDVLQNATRHLMKKVLRRYVWQNVQVIQGENTYDLGATPAYDESESVDEGVILTYRQQDFLFDIDDLVAKKRDEGMRDIARGDKIVWTRQHTSTDEDGNEVVVREDTGTYEVMSDGSEPSWRPGSRYHNWLRVHTKRLLPIEYVEPS